MVKVEEHYETINITEDSSLRKFIEEKHHKNYDRGCAYYELTDKEEDIDSGKEVILMNNVRIILYNL